MSRHGCCRSTARGRTTDFAETCAATTASDEVDIAIVGCGAGGGVLAQRLARAGWSVVVFDAGPLWDPDRDWVSDEAGSHHLYWTEPRSHRRDRTRAPGVEQFRPRRRRVDGALRRLRPPLPSFGFPTFTDDGVGADWPIDYGSLRSYYTDIEAELPVAGEAWPWGDPHRYPHSPHPLGGNGLVFQRGAVPRASR